MSNDKTSKSSSGTSIGAAKGSTPNLQEQILKNAALQGSASGSTWTQADSNATVQGVFQQLLGRNAQGVEYAKALSLLNTGAGSSAGMTQAVTEYVQGLPEYQARTQNRWLEAIYNDLNKNIMEARS